MTESPGMRHDILYIRTRLGSLTYMSVCRHIVFLPWERLEMILGDSSVQIVP